MIKITIKIENDNGLKSHSVYEGEYSELKNEDWNDIVDYSLSDHNSV